MRSMITTALILGLAASAGAQDCAWTLWATDWSVQQVITGPDQNPPNEHYLSPNWDFTDSENIWVGLDAAPLPDGGTNAFHWWLADLSFPYNDNGGNGGIYQEFTVTPGVPLEYSVWFTAKGWAGLYWFELLLIDGPFDVFDADKFPENATQNNPSKLRTASFENPTDFTNSTIGWTEWTHLQPAENGPAGPRPQTITPTGDTVTIVLKGAHLLFTGTPGAFETYWDEIEVTQNGGPNLLTNGDFEDGAQNTICDNTLVTQDPNFDNYFITVMPPACDDQHTVTGVTPTSASADGPVVLTVTGTFLELVTDWTMRRPADNPAATLTATSVVVGTGPNETTADVTFDLAGAQAGNYSIFSAQDAPCLSDSLVGEFVVDCPTQPLTVSPAIVTDPGASEELRIIGPGASGLTSVSLSHGEPGGQTLTTIDGTALTPDGDDLLVTFDLSCAPRGKYRLSNCLGDEDFEIRKSLPSGACAWQPWGAAWSKINAGEDLDPDLIEEAYDPTNWDYDLSETTILDLTKDVPPGGETNAFHWFLDTQDTISNSWGSGGIYQEVAVTPGVPIEYSYYWKGKGGNTISWFEFVIIDGGFGGFEADAYPDTANGNAPYPLRRKELTESSFEWEQVLHTDPAEQGPAGPRPQTLTPTGDLVTVVFKSGALPQTDDAGVEMLVDNVVLSQGGGGNLLANPGFEDGNQLSACTVQTMAQDACDDDFWLRSDFVVTPPIVCSDPRADADFDGDVDQTDVAAYQLCLADFGSSDFCTCIDQLSGAPDDMTTIVDFTALTDCATGPDVLHADNPNPLCADQP